MLITMSEQASDQELVIRPSWKHYKLMMKTTPVFLFVIVAMSIFREGTEGLILVAGTVALSLVVVAVYFRNAQIRLTDTEIVRTGVTGRKIVKQRSDVATVVRAILPVSKVDHRMYYNLFLLDDDGRRLLRLKNTHWAEPDMNQLVTRLGMPTQDFWNPLSIKDFSRHHPKALPLMERRPWLLAFCIMGGLVVAVTVAVIVIGAFTVNA